MNIVGLGKAGCKIADGFNRYPQYTSYKIDVGQTGDKCYDFPFFKTTEEYEEKTPNLKKFFNDIRGEILFIVGGSGAISCAILNILQQLDSKNISILYIQPELLLLNETQAARERLVRGVLQEYARCALLKRIYLISNQDLEKTIGEVPIMSYFDRLNEVLVHTFHMLNVFKNSEPVIGKIEGPRDVCQISTFGVYDFIKNEEKLFFPLSCSRDICYIYGLSEEKLKTDGSLFRMIVNQMKGKLSDNTNISYAVFPTKYDENIAYCVAHASLIQT